MDVPEFVPYLQLMDTLFTVIGVATFLFMVGSAYPEVNGVTRKVPVKPNRPSEHSPYFGPRPL
ncbi:MAG TPA: hypothetical protein VKE72_03055 [Methylocella sp.]|jgi:hypothetical protein|nr:hypothetical protein [Methylocella sp.]